MSSTIVMILPMESLIDTNEKQPVPEFHSFSVAHSMPYVHHPE